MGFDRVKAGSVTDGSEAFRHMSTSLFPILVSGGSGTDVAIKPESIDDFMQVMGSGAVTRPYASYFLLRFLRRK